MRPFITQRTGTSVLLVLLMLFLGLNVSPTFAQVSKTITVTGEVTDDQGSPLMGVTVLVVGQSNLGAYTDIDGTFSISSVPSNATLRFSFIGMKTKDVQVAGQTKLRVQMDSDQELLEELVVVGYSTVSKESLTGSLQSISGDDLKVSTTPSVENLLSSRAPGVYVAPGSGRPGAKGSVVIRGKSTINGSTAPLWVVDGVIVGTNAGTLNPNDIETMSILKDAASTAVYGSQGANGVIVVTTKSAKSGKLSVNVSANGGITRLSHGNLQVMDGAELYDYYSSFSNAEHIKFDRWKEDLRNSNFDWWDFATQTGSISSLDLSLNGGTDQISSMTSLGVYNEEGAVKGYDFTRYNFMFKSSYRPTEWLTLKPYISGSMQTVSDRQHSVAAMYSNLPWDSAIDSEGNPVPHRSSLWVNSNSTNYYYDLQWDKSSSVSYDLSGNFDFDVKLTNWLTFASVNNYRYSNYSSSSYTDPRSSGGEGVNGRVSEYRYDYTRRYTNQLLRFNKGIESHYLNGVLGYEYNDARIRDISTAGTGLVAGFETLRPTTKPEKADGTISEWAVQSIFANLNYSYDDRYLAQFSLRRDGASNFGANAQYGNFFSVSGGWNIHNEAFFDSSLFNALKLRVSYGSVGNRPDALYPQYDLYSATATYNGVSGLLISQVGNKDLSWEKSYTAGVGLDVTLLDRISLTLDLYDKNTSDLLYRVPVSGLNGVTSVWKNIGAVDNKGFEITLNADIIKTNDWDWSVGMNIGLNRNKVTSLYGTPDPITGEVPPIIIGGGLGIAGEAHRILKVGMDADTWYLPEWAGVDPDNGSPLWYKNTLVDGKRSRETTSNYAEAEMVPVASYNPDFFGGLNTQLRWKNMDLSAIFGFSYGGEIYNYTRSEYDSDGAYTDRNQMKLMSGWSRWEKKGDNATHPVPSYNNSSNSNKTSSRYLEDGSFFKLRNLSLGYNFDLKKYKIEALRLSLTGENLFTLTRYSGVDPELPASDNGSIIGVTSTVYPSTRKITLGLSLTF